MVKSNVKSLLIILLVVIIIASFQKFSFAASDTGLAGLLLDENTTLGTTTNTENTVNNEMENNTNNTNNTNTPVITTPPVLNTASQNVNNNINNNSQATLPKTGESDIYIVTVLIAVFAIVTIYAYKKIRDYNGL